MPGLPSLNRPLMHRTLTTKLSTKRRHILKNKVFMAACTVLQTSRHIFYLSTRDPTNQEIGTTMETLDTVTVVEFLRRCRSMSKTHNEKRYVRHVANKYIKGILNYTFGEHLKRLKALDTLRILNDVAQDSFYFTHMMEAFEEQGKRIDKKIETNII